MRSNGRNIHLHDKLGSRERGFHSIMPKRARAPETDDGEQQSTDNGNAADLMPSVAGRGDEMTGDEPSVADSDEGTSEDDAGEGGSEGGDEDDDGDDGYESSDSGQPVEKKVLPQRGTRGQRMSRLVGEAAEADEQFWGQAAFNEEGSDEEFSESDVSDATSESTDSDIDLPEEDAGEDDAGAKGAGGRANLASGSRSGTVEVVDDDDGRKGGPGKGRGYVDKGAGLMKGVDLAAAAAAMGGSAALARSKKAAKEAAAAASGGEGTGASSSFSSSASSLFAAAASSTPGGVPRSLRASTQEYSEEAEARRKAELPADGRMGGKGAGASSSSTFSAPPIPRPSQAAVLSDAAHTTIENLRSLDALQAQESERQAQDALAVLASGRGHAFPPGLPLLRVHSKRGCPDTLTFTEVDEFPSGVNASKASAGAPACECCVRGRASEAGAVCGSGQPVNSTRPHDLHSCLTRQSSAIPSTPPVSPAAFCADPKPRKCAVTGAPARFFDPLTQQPYADAGAFRVLRERYAATIGPSGLPKGFNMHANANAAAASVSSHSVAQYQAAANTPSAYGHAFAHVYNGPGLGR